MQRYKIGQSGFSLLELMTVMVIMTILVTMGFAGYRKAILAARERTMAQNLEMIYEALRLYRARNVNAAGDNLYPDGTEVELAPCSDGNPNTSCLAGLNAILNTHILSGSGEEYTYLSPDGGVTFVITAEYVSFDIGLDSDKAACCTDHDLSDSFTCDTGLPLC